MIWLNKEQLILLHGDIIAATGGLDGLRDDGTLQSALNSPLQTYAGDDLFPSAVEKCVRLACGLTQFHPFVDGNKRIGAHAMLVMLRVNGVKLCYTQEGLSEVFLSLADGAFGYEKLLNWVNAHLAQ